MLHSLSPHLLSIPLGALLGALARRSVGGWLSATIGYDITDPFIRLLWGVLMGAVALAAGAVWWQAAAVVPLLWVGSTTGMFNGFTMGRAPGRNVWKDAACMLLYSTGCVSLLCAAAVLAGYGWSSLCLLGAAVLCPVVYELAWLIPLNIPALGCLPQDPPPTAELAWGAVVGVAVAGTVLLRL